MTPACRPVATHRRAPSGQAGFSLVELMVALAVLGLLASVVVLSMPGGDGAVRSESARLAARVAAARDLAVTGGRPITVWLSPSGYGFARRQGGAWQTFDEGPLRPHDWPRGITASTDHRGADGGAARDGDQAATGPAAARLRFDTLGLTAQAMTITLTDGTARRQVTIGANGRVQSHD